MVILEITYEEDAKPKENRRFLREYTEEEKKIIEEERYEYNIGILRFLGLLFLIFEIFLFWYKYAMHIKVAQHL